MKSNIKIVWGVMLLVGLLLSNACYTAWEVVWRAMFAQSTWAMEEPAPGGFTRGGARR